MFLEGRAAKQLMEEPVELLKYSKLKSLGNILYEYDFILLFILLNQSEFKLIFSPSMEQLSDDRKKLNASGSMDNEDVSVS